MPALSGIWIDGRYYRADFQPVFRFHRDIGRFYMSGHFERKKQPPSAGKILLIVLVVIIVLLADLAIAVVIY